jgi:hypothetical protein
MTVATASVLFHRFQKATQDEVYDNFVSLLNHLFKIRLRKKTNNTIIETTIGGKNPRQNLEFEYCPNIPKVTVISFILFGIFLH